MSFDTTQWRLIIHNTPLRGAQNMAIDEAILKNVVTQASLPTLRLYGWNPPCLSLGYAQPVKDVNLSKLNSLNWDIVRRPTGGRAIIHTDEITYSVMASETEPRVAGGVLESYRRLSIALVNALKLLGLDANADKEYPLPQGSQTKGPVCFDVPSKYEITVNGKKLIGSAQARRDGGVLQHGSLPLHGDLTRITQVLNYNSEQEQKTAAARLLEHATTIETITNNYPTWQKAANAFTNAFQKTLNIKLLVSDLSEQEAALSDTLVKEKYGNYTNWTARI